MCRRVLQESAGEWYKRRAESVQEVLQESAGECYERRAEKCAGSATRAARAAHG